jgi:hypothetical protein
MHAIFHTSGTRSSRERPPIGLAGTSAVGVERSLAGCQRHRDDSVSGGNNATEDHVLPGRRMRQNRMPDNNGRYMHRFQKGKDVLAVWAAVDAVFVLHYHDVKAVKHVRGS